MTKQQTNFDINCIENLLKSHNLHKYIQRFKDDGYVKQDLLDLKENELNAFINDLNIINPIHIKKLRYAIKEFKLKYGNNTGNITKEGYIETKISSNIVCKNYRSGNRLPNIGNHVFISKQATQELSEYIVKENWGKNNILLYKYLDYIWRLQLIDKMVKLFWFNNEKRLVFNTGLYTAKNNDELLLCLVPNNINPNKKKYSQPWRVTLGDYGLRHCSFMTKKELITLHGLNDYDVPVRTTFENSVKFDPEYNITINLFDRVRTAKERILQTLRDDIGFYGKLTQNELENLVDQSIVNTLNNARNNPNICGKQVFMERDLVNNRKLTKGYHLELLLPLTLTINNCCAYFAIVLRINNKLKEYEIMSIITREMAYSNARLIGYVNIGWLKPFVNTNKLILPSLPLLNFNSNINDSHCFQNMTTQYGLNNNNTVYNPLNMISLIAMLRLTLPQQLNSN